MSEWHKSDDEMPQAGTAVLCWFPIVSCFGIAYWDDEDQYWKEDGEIVHFPTHWQPLPEPPIDTPK